MTYFNFQVQFWRKQSHIMHIFFTFLAVLSYSGLFLLILWTSRSQAWPRTQKESLCNSNLGWDYNPLFENLLFCEVLPPKLHVQNQFVQCSDGTIDVPCAKMTPFTTTLPPLSYKYTVVRSFIKMISYLQFAYTLPH